MTDFQSKCVFTVLYFEKIIDMMEDGVSLQLEVMLQFSFIVHTHQISHLQSSSSSEAEQTANEEFLPEGSSPAVHKYCQ